jgi:hypothetical protein
MSDYIRDPVAFAKFQQRPVSRAETVQISGTRMRQFLTADDKQSFDQYVPQTLSPDMKDKYWSILKGEHGAIVDSRRRSSLLKILFESVKNKNKYKKGR